MSGEDTGQGGGITKVRQCNYQSKVIVLFSLSNFTLCVPAMQQHPLIEAGNYLINQAFVSRFRKA